MSVSPISRPLLSPPKSLDGSGDDILSLAIESKDEKEILAILAKSYELTLQLRDGLPGQEDPWSCNFTDEAFLALTEELQKKIYRMANICGNEPLVDRLNGLGMRKEIPR